MSPNDEHASTPRPEAPDYSDLGLTACLINTTLKRAPEPSHTARLLANVEAILAHAGVAVTSLRATDYDIAFGVQPDMRETGVADEWPDKVWPHVRDADILIIGTPLWLGEESSVCRVIIERLYAHSGQRNEKGQYRFYGKVGGAVITGNEDGVKHASMTVLYAMQHVGYTIPPQADCGWIGEAGPGPSYGDDGAGYDNDFTRRNTTFMTWNLIHLAAMLKQAGGVPAYGNQVPAWDAGERFGHPPIPGKG
ncbi:flavodoxin family protein [Cucumibacter marinus]|uniref:flavodoxin family protein n=1 Tax=Cucumibacter marinus TaxID=1121252 RepID=UPI0003FC187F|nr:flavodoxin family protein [Cucumibacter marinus]